MQRNRQFSCSIFDNVAEENGVANYARLLCLITEQGTVRMLQFLMTNLPNEATTLEEALADNRSHFESLVRSKVLNQKQFNELFPGLGIPVAVSRLDMSLLYVLARNLAANKEKVSYRRFERAPGPTLKHKLPQHDIIRIRNMRNALFHLGSPQIETEAFDIMWKEISDALRRLGTDQTVLDDYRLRDLDKMQTLNYYFSFREEMHNDLESLYRSEIRKRKHFMFCLAAVVLILCVMTVVSSCIMYKFTGTWHSCMHSMITLESSSKVYGVISYMPRKGWGANPPIHQSPLLKKPLPYVIISHSAQTGICLTTDDCCLTAQITQKISEQHGLDDVAFNFMVGNDGVIYEGRPWGVQSATAKGWNQEIISIGFMGTFVHSPPSDVATRSTPGFLQYLVDKGLLHHNFTLYGLCQVRVKFPDAPGAALYKIIQTWHGEGGSNTWKWRSRKGGPKCDTNPPNSPPLYFPAVSDHL